MALPIYRFRNFRLDPQARELYRDEERIVLPVSTLDCLVYLIRHRDRSVGRDELTAAVWGRTEVSDVSLNHAIMRLRRLLGDTGNEQNSIRTVQRLGYRWIVDPTIEDSADPSAVAPSRVAQDASGTSGRRRVPMRWIAACVLFVAACGLVLAIVSVRHRDTGSDVRSASARRPPAIVLPAEVDASGEWAWLRLGLMDMVANRLRKGDLATMPSETVVSLVNAHQFDGGERIGNTGVLVKPHVERAGGMWTVRLVANVDGRELIATARGSDVLGAGRTSADDLLVKLGHAPPVDSGDPGSASATAELAQRIAAAALAGQLDVARKLVGEATDEERANPEIALSRSALEFFSGEYEASREHAEALLDRIPADRQPDFRARVLKQLGVTLFREGRNEDADRAFAEAIRLLALGDDSETLAAVYTGRGVVAGQEQRLDAAAAYLGQARVLHAMSNDPFGVARVDLNLGAVTMDRGQPAAAVPIFRDAAKQFEILSTPEALNSALRSLADAYSMLLEHDQALATTDRFWPVADHNRNPREGWWLTLSRAVALAGVGRLADADVLIKRVRDESDPDKDATARIEAEALAADLALLRADYARAASLAGAALTPALESTNWQDYASTWFTRIRALQLGGHLEDAAGEIERLHVWADKAPGERRQLYVVLAQADQAAAAADETKALPLYASAMARAERLGIPEDIVVVGEPYVDALIKAGQIEQASAVGGLLARWADQDVRAAWTQARLYHALHKSDAARTALDRARRLAGERTLPADLVRATIPAN